MNRLSSYRPMIDGLLALMLTVGLAACGAQGGTGTLSENAVPTFSRDRVAREAPVEVRRLYADRWMDLYVAAPSPDGRYITDINWNMGDLVVRDVVTGEETPITHNAGKIDAWPYMSVFSPDGNRIAYDWAIPDGADPDGYDWEIRSIGMDGTDMRVHLRVEVDEEARALDWSKDGRRLLIGLEPVGGDDQLLTLDLVTNETRVIKTIDHRRGHADGVFFSPDGRFVAYDLSSDTDSRARDIFLLSSDGQSERTLVQTPDREQLLGWLPDGSGILFHRDAEDSKAIWKLPLDDGQPSGPPELVKDDVWDITGIGFSDDAFLYRVVLSRPGVHTASYDLETGRVLEALEPVDDPSGPGSDLATWSPDGSRIAYLQGGIARGRFIIRSVTGEILQEFPSTLDAWGSRFGWAAQGLVIQGRDREGRRGTFLISLETGELTLVRESPTRQTDPLSTVSEDGLKVYVHDSGGAIVEVEISTGTERVLVERDGHSQVKFPDAPQSWRGAVSPDGDKIALQVRPAGGQPGGGIEIFSRSTGETRVIAEVVWACCSTWSPDSRYLLLEGRLEEEEIPRLLRISAEDGSVITLAHGPNRFFRPRVSPDGRHVTVTTGEFRQELWRMTFNSGN